MGQEGASRGNEKVEPVRSKTRLASKFPSGIVHSTPDAMKWLVRVSDSARAVEFAQGELHLQKGARGFRIA